MPHILCVYSQYTHPPELSLLPPDTTYFYSTIYPYTLRILSSFSSLLQPPTYCSPTPPSSSLPTHQWHFSCSMFFSLLLWYPSNSSQLLPRQHLHLIFTTSIFSHYPLPHTHMLLMLTQPIFFFFSPIPSSPLFLGTFSSAIFAIHSALSSVLQL